MRNDTPRDLQVLLHRDESSFRLGVVPSFETRTFSVSTAMADGNIWLVGAERGRLQVTQSPMISTAGARVVEWKVENLPVSPAIRRQ